MALLENAFQSTAEFGKEDLLGIIGAHRGYAIGKEYSTLQKIDLSIILQAIDAEECGGQIGQIEGPRSGKTP